MARRVTRRLTETNLAGHLAFQKPLQARKFSNDKLACQ